MGALGPGATVADVFISYAREDHLQALAVERRLQDEGVSVWRDRQIPAGDNYVKTIHAELVAAKIVVVLWSAESRSSDYIQGEAEYARVHRTYVPVRLDAAEPIVPFNVGHEVDLRSPLGLDELAKEVLRKLGRQKAAAPVVTAAARLEDGRPFGVIEFLDRADLRSARRLMIMANTGSSTVRAAHSVLQRKGSDELPKDGLEVCVLLRSPMLSDRGRAEASSRTVELLSDLAKARPQIRAHVRHYAGTNPLNSVLVEHASGHIEGRLSFYDWRHESLPSVKDSAVTEGFVRSYPDSLLKVNLSWFRHLWGNRNIHTLVFDFDDTLALTTDAQTLGWVDCVKQAVDRRLCSIADLEKEVRKAWDADGKVDDKKLFLTMREIFLDKQQESEISEHVFGRKLDDGKIAENRRTRLKTRNRETLGAQPIQEIVSALPLLAETYQIVIVSATSEKLIRDWFAQHPEIDRLVSHVIGREAPAALWENTETKTENFVRLSAILGIPLDRMVFIGDSNSDFRSAHQLRLHFIEAACNAQLFGRPTLIHDGKPKWRISQGATPTDIKAILDDVEATSVNERYSFEGR